MQVCHVWQNFFPLESGGVERYILSLSNYLSALNPSNSFRIITDRSAYIPLSSALKVSNYQKSEHLEIYRLGPNPCTLLRNGFNKASRRQSNRLNELLMLSLYKEASRIQKIEEVDIFHLHGVWQLLYPTIGLLLSQRFHKPFIVTLHGDSVRLDDRFAMSIRSPETIELLHKAGAITTFSKETFTLLQELGLDKKAWFIPNFISIGRFKRPSTMKKLSGIKVVVVSRLTKPKDPITPIRAFARVKKKFPDSTLTIVGYGPLSDYISRLVHELHIEDSVSIVGMKSDVREFLWNSNIYIGTRGSYITTLEAWAAGTIVLAPKLGIMNELISNNENGLLFPPGDADQLASTLIRVIQDKQLQETLITNGLATVQKHDITNAATRFLEIYNSVTKD